MPEADNTKQKNEQGGHKPLHSEAAVRMMRSRPPAAEAPTPVDYLKLDRRIKARVAIAAVLVIAMLAYVVSAGMAAGIIGGRTATPVGGSDMRELTTRGFVEVVVRADKWDAEGSTPAIIHFRPSEGTGELYHAINIEARESFELEAGTYHVSYVSPIDADGGIYRVPQEGVVEVSAGHTVNIAADLVPVAPEEVTRDEYLGIIDATQAAIDAGDASLQGEAGAALMGRLQANAAAGPHFAEESAEPQWEAPPVDDTYYPPVYVEPYAQMEVWTAPESESVAIEEEDEDAASSSTELDEEGADENGEGGESTEDGASEGSASEASAEADAESESSSSASDAESEQSSSSSAEDDADATVSAESASSSSR